jgi:hypothetical protein
MRLPVHSIKSTSILLFMLAIAAIPLHAQLPLNGGFERWSNEYTPEDWQTANNPPILLNTYQSLNAHSGTYSANIYTQLYNGNIRSGLLKSHSVPFTTALRSIQGWYKLQTLGRDRIRVRVIIYDKNNTLLDTQEFELKTPADSWTSFSFPLDIDPDDGSENGPLMVSISFEIVPDGTLEQVGAVAAFDDIMLETAPAGVTDITPASGEALFLIRDSNTLKMHMVDSGLPASNVSLALYDMLGIQKLHSDTYASEGQDVILDLQGLPAGCYLAVARCGTLIRHQKIVVP